MCTDYSTLSREWVWYYIYIVNLVVYSTVTCNKYNSKVNGREAKEYHFCRNWGATQGAMSQRLKSEEVEGAT